ncbi:hypothetical protein [Posidoniimonas polymericola]|nr:hypothetical protein [Posidoniimonas polymericola]
MRCFSLLCNHDASRKPASARRDRRTFESLESRELLAADLDLAETLASRRDALPDRPAETRVERGLFRAAPRVAFPDLSSLRTPHISDAQKENLKQLRADLLAIRADSEVTPEMVERLATDLAAAAEVASRPSEESVATLRAAIAEVVEDQELTAVEVKQLQASFADVVTSTGITTELAEAIKTDVQEVFAASGVDQADVKIILADFRAIAAELQNRDPLISDAQQENLQKLADDLADVRSQLTLTPELVEEIQSDLAAIKHGATPPERSLVRALATQVRDARADGLVTAEERAGIANAWDAVLTSATIPPEERDALWEDLSATGLTAADVHLVASDLAAIREEFGANHPRRGRR